jgi:pentapeptide repeat protein
MTSTPPLPDDPRFEKLRTGQPLEFAAPPNDREETPDEKAARTIPARWLEILAGDHKLTISVPIQISHATIKGSLNLEYALFECNVSITDSEFIETVDLSFAVFSKAASFTRSCFRRQVYFRAAHAYFDFEINETSFAEAARFQDLRVAKVLAAIGASFADVDFQRIEIGKDAVFQTDTHGRKVLFGGKARFDGAHIVGDANFQGAEFKSGVTFDGMRVDGNAVFVTDDSAQRVTFVGDAHFNFAHIAGSANFMGADFRADVHFDAVHFGGPAFFRPDTRCNQVTFANLASFMSAEFSLDAQFIKAAFQGNVDFDNAHFRGEAKFDSSKFAPSGKQSFIGARFERGAYFESSQFQGETDFSASVAERDVRFSNAQFLGAVSFQEARFHSVFFGDPALEVKEAWWPRLFLWKEPKLSKPTLWSGSVDLRGLTYERIYVYLPDLLPRLAPFSRQPYSQLEVTLRKVGDDQRARKVYFERRRQERKHKFRTGRFFVWFLDWVYKLGANCGIALLRLIVFALALILLGAFLLKQPRALEPAKKDPSQPTALCSSNHFVDGLAVSIHYFLPMDVPVGADCKPASERIPYQTTKGLRVFPYVLLPSPSWYATIFLRIAGTILMGVGVAAVSGLLRRIAH